MINELALSLAPPMGPQLMNTAQTSARGGQLAAMVDTTTTTTTGAPFPLRC